MEHEFIAHHIKEDFRGLSTSQPRCSRKYSEDHLKHSTEHSKYSKTTSEVLAPAVLGYEELVGLLDPGLRDCAHRIDKIKIPDTHKEGRNCNPPRTLLCNPPRTPTS